MKLLITMFIMISLGACGSSHANQSKTEGKKRTIVKAEELMPWTPAKELGCENPLSLTHNADETLHIELEQNSDSIETNCSLTK